MSDFPYLGNRISLISSSQIRYEGILYTIDTVQGTVTLAQVRSFGTEDRATERPVAERDEIYDFIVFRGADIKDIKLCNVQKTYDDPAIVEMGSSTSGSGGAPGGPLGVGPRMGAAPQQAFGAAAAVPAAGAFSLNGAGGGGGGAVSRLPAAAAAPGGPVGSRESQLISGGGIMDYAAASQPSAPAAGASGAAASELAGSSRSTTPSRRSPTTDQGVQTHQDRQSHRYRDSQQRGGYQQGGRGGGGYRSQRGARRGGRGQSRGTFTVSTRPLKFDGDFDFEEANKKFEELAAQLAKTKLEDTTTAAAAAAAENGEASAEAEPAEEGEIREEVPPVFYNKTKSFFDNISCDAVEKARDNRQRRQDWQKERRQNLETFGVEGTRRPYRRGGYGRGYNRGGGGYYGNRGGGGGYYGNRGGGGYGRGYYGRGYYNYNRGYGGRRGGGGGGDGSFAPRGGRSDRGQPEASSLPRAEAVQN